MAKISSLTDNSNEIVYPQTRANAVIMGDGTTAEASINLRPKMVLSSEDPASTIDDNTLYGVYGETGQITNEDLSDSCVTTPKLAASSVTTAKIASGAVTTAKIATGAVTASQLGSSSVTTVKLASNSVTAAKCDWSTFLDKIYPVGSIYMSVSHTSASAVATALGGGTWVAWGAGRVPLGMGSNGTTNYTTVEATGGQEKHTNPLGNNGAAGIRNYGDRTYVVNGANVNSLWKMDGTTNSVWAWSHNGDGQDSTDRGHSGVRLYGRTEEASNLQPYITVYMYKRTA